MRPPPISTRPIVHLLLLSPFHSSSFIHGPFVVHCCSDFACSSHSAPLRLLVCFCARRRISIASSETKQNTRAIFFFYQFDSSFNDPFLWRIPMKFERLFNLNLKKMECLYRARCTTLVIFSSSSSSSSSSKSSCSSSSINNNKVVVVVVRAVVAVVAVIIIK